MRQNTSNRVLYANFLSLFQSYFYGKEQPRASPWAVELRAFYSQGFTLGCGITGFQP